MPTPRTRLRTKRTLSNTLPDVVDWQNRVWRSGGHAPAKTAYCSHLALAEILKVVPKSSIKELNFLVGFNRSAAFEKLIYPHSIQSALTLEADIVPTYSESAGVSNTSTGGLGYLRTGFIPTSNGMSDTDQCLFSYTLSVASGTRVPLGGYNATSAQCNLYVMYTGTSQASISNATPSVPMSPAGLKLATTDGSNCKGYTRFLNHNSVSRGSASPTFEMGLCNHRFNSSYFFYNGALGAYGFSTSLTASQSAAISKAIDDLYERINRKAAIRYAFFGDSVTNGVGASSGSTKYSSLICSTRGVTELNSGINGTVLQNTDALSNNGRDRYVADIYNNAPSKVFILYGLNDLRYNGANFSVANFENDLGEVVQGLIDGGVYPDNIILGSPPYMKPSAYNTASPYNAGSTLKHQQHRDAVLNVAAAKKTRYVDVYQAMIDAGGDSIMSDDFHPNDTGHQVIANAFLSVA